MESADRRRARLRHELQQAYSAWLLASRRDDLRDCVHDAGQSDGQSDGQPDGSPQEESGAGPTVKDLWAGYLAARERLVEATAVQARSGPADPGTRGPG